MVKKKKPVVEEVVEEVKQELSVDDDTEDDGDFEDPVRELDTYTVEEKCEHFDRLYELARYVFGGILSDEGLDVDDVNIMCHELVETLGPNANEFLEVIAEEDCNCDDCCDECRKRCEEEANEQKLSN